MVPSCKIRHRDLQGFKCLENTPQLIQNLNYQRAVPLSAN